MELMAYCTASLTSLSDSVSYIAFLFSEWRIEKKLTELDNWFGVKRTLRQL